MRLAANDTAAVYAIGAFLLVLLGAGAIGGC